MIRKMFCRGMSVNSLDNEKVSSDGIKTQAQVTEHSVTGKEGVCWRETACLLSVSVFCGIQP